MVICDSCGKEFGKYSNRSKHNFCCTKCKGEWQKRELVGEGNPFFERTHTIATKKRISSSNTGRRYSKDVNIKKGSQGDKNPAYKKGYWMIRKHHIHKFKEDYCVDCGISLDLEIHHEPYMDESNCLEWKGRVYTLCRRCHMKRHRDGKGKMVRIYG